MSEISHLNRVTPNGDVVDFFILSRAQYPVYLRLLIV